MKKEPKTEEELEQFHGNSQQTGTDFQVLYFVYQLLSMDEKEVEWVGYETRDDVSIEYKNGSALLIQVKHSNDDTSTITDSDEGLWNTFDMWAKRLTLTDKVRKFKFITNRGVNSVFIRSVLEYQLDAKSLQEVRDVLGSIVEKSNDDKLNDFRNNVLALDDNNLQKLLDVVFECQLSKDTIERECLELINKRTDYTFEDKLMPLFTILYGELLKKKYDEMKKVSPYKYTYEEFSRLFGKCKKAFGDIIINYIKRDYEVDLKKVDDYTFIQQLNDIDYFEDDCIDEKIDYVNQFRNAINHIDEWIREDLTLDEIDTFYSDLRTNWKSVFKKTYRRVDKSNFEAVKDCAVDIVDQVKMYQAKLRNIQNTDFTNGVYWKLSNKPEIGWLYNWEEKYKKKEVKDENE